MKCIIAVVDNCSLLKTIESVLEGIVRSGTTLLTQMTIGNAQVVYLSPIFSRVSLVRIKKQRSSILVL